MPALPAFVSPDVSCKSNFYSRRCRSQANLTSWGERTSVREGHKVKQIMCLLYEAVIPCVSTVDLLFVLKFSNRSFFCCFFYAVAISSLCCAVAAGHCSGRRWDHRGQGHVRSLVTPLSALMHSGQSCTLFQVCHKLQRQQIGIKSNLARKDDLDIWLCQKKTGKVGVYNVIAYDLCRLWSQSWSSMWAASLILNWDSNERLSCTAQYRAFNTQLKDLYLQRRSDSCFCAHL